MILPATIQIIDGAIHFVVLDSHDHASGTIRVAATGTVDGFAACLPSPDANLGDGQGHVEQGVAVSIEIRNL